MNKVLFGILFVMLLGVLGLFGFLVSTMLLQRANLPLDYISFSFFLFNFCVVGFLMIAYKGPTKLQQSFTVLMSSLMAYSLTNLPDLTTWLLLGFLAVWGLLYCYHYRH